MIAEATFIDGLGQLRQGEVVVNRKAQRASHGFADVAADRFNSEREVHLPARVGLVLKGGVYVEVHSSRVTFL